LESISSPPEPLGQKFEVDIAALAADWVANQQRANGLADSS